MGRGKGSRGQAGVEAMVATVDSRLTMLMLNWCHMVKITRFRGYSKWIPYNIYR